MTRRQFTLSVIGTFFLLGFLVYGISLGNDFIRWDDGLLIFENPSIREISPWSLNRIFSTYDPELYIPLTLFSYQVDYQIGGIQPFIFHFQSLLWHIGNAALVFLLAWKLLKKKWAAVLCGALFLLHPLQTEAISWAAGRKDVLSTFWFLASIIWYMMYSEKGKRKHYYLSIAAFLLALLAKAMVVTLPVVLILIDDLKQRKWSKDTILEKIPYFALSIVFGIVAILGKMHVLGRSSGIDKALVGIKSAVFYVQKILWPDGFSVLYVLHDPIEITSMVFLLPIFLCIAAVAAAFFARNRMRIIFFAIAFYCITLAPTANNFAKGMVELYFASDRYAYIPSIGIFLLIALLLSKAVHRFVSSGENLPMRRTIANGIIVVLFTSLGILSFQQSLKWRNTETLFTHVLTLYPNSHVAHANMGGNYRRAGDLAKAKQEYTAANAIAPHTRTTSNLAAIERQQGNYNNAISLYKKAMKIDPVDPDPYFGLGVVYVELKNYEEAERLYRQALSMDPKREEVWSNLGTVLKQQGRFVEAVETYEQVLNINPYFVVGRFNLAVTLALQGGVEDALEQYARTIRDEPDFTTARMNYGLLLYQTGDPDGAEEQFRAVLAINPSHKSARSALGQMGVR